MVGYNGNKWTLDQLALMERLHGERVKWRFIAERVGHPQASCQQMMSRVRTSRRNVEARVAAREKMFAARAAAVAKRALAAAAPKPPVVIIPPVKRQAPAVPEASYARGTSTAKLVMDAELRSRIELQGVTAGLLGDPMPGRSALDRRLQGMVDRPDAPDRRYSDFRPDITLPGGPVR